jgi:hypothetical protein
MLDEKSQTLENALYVALNTQEESAVMAERLAARSRGLEKSTPPSASRSGRGTRGSRRQ